VQQLSLGGRDVVTGAQYPAQPQLVPFYQKLFSLYKTTPTSFPGFRAGGRPASSSSPFGTHTRIFRLNDYDFGQGTEPLVTYTDLPQFVLGVASTATRTYPLAYSQPFNFLNLDLYAQDTWKVTPTLTWTFGLRATDNSNPLNPHHALARLPGSFDSISHDSQSAAHRADPNACRRICSSPPTLTG